MREFKPSKLQIVVILFCILVMLVGYIFIRHSPKAIDLESYNALLYSGNITEVKAIENELVLHAKSGVFSIVKDGVNMRELLEYMPVKIESRNDYGNVLLLLIMLLLVGAYIYYVRKTIKLKSLDGNGILVDKNLIAEEGNALHSPIVPSTSKLKFSDVAGIKGVKDELVEIVDFLKNPSVYQRMGVKLPKGVLLIGPPGVGKTMIAKAVAGEANVPFFYQSGASFVQIYVGMGAKRVRELFAVAKSNAPSIIFIDEIDAVGKARGGLRNDEREATLNQLLTEMDGFEDNSGVIVIAATNRYEMIDEALLRSGRFDRRIFVSLPDLQDREKIISSYIADKNHNVDISDIAKMCVGFSGAAISTMVNEAAINALRRKSKMVEIDDFLAVRDKVLLGKKRLARYSDKEKNIQATYQAAKALCAYWFETGFDKISLIGDFTKEVDKEIESRTELTAKIKVALAGIVASKICFGEMYSNSSDDLNKARRLAGEMVERYAMGERLLPATQDVENILSKAFDEVETFLNGMKKSLEKLANVLLEEENLTKDRIKMIIGEVF